MYQIKISQGQIDWTALDIPGVSMKVLFKDEASGAMTVITRMEAGAEIPAHFHTQADETVFVLEGEFIEDGERHGPGWFFVGKAGTPHGPHKTLGGCRVLTHFSAELDFQLI